VTGCPAEDKGTDEMEAERKPWIHIKACSKSVCKKSLVYETNVAVQPKRNK
jgi:hypothetical protein